MRHAFGWMLVVLLCGCCATERTLGDGNSDARLEEARADFNAATKLKEEGRYSEALQRAEHGLALREALLGGSHPDVASCLDLVGDLYRRQGELARAEPALQKALAMREEALAPNHPDVAQSLNNVAGLYFTQGLYGKAEPLYQRALAIREAALGDSHPDVAISLHNLATLYFQQGMYGPAEPLYQRAIAVYEASLGKDHPYLANSLNNLALLYWRQGSYERAVPLLQRALAIRELARGKTHPDVADSLTSLALLYTEQGVYDRVEPLYQRALAIYEATLGENHPRLATALGNLASFYVLQGSYLKAEPLYQRSLAIREATLGKTHSDVAQALLGLASIYVRQGMYGRAEPLYQRALTIYEASLGKNHPNVAFALLGLASLYMNQGTYERAELLYQRALAIEEAAVGPTHRDVANTLNLLANVYLNQEMYDRAEPLYQRALAIYEASLGENHPSTAAMLGNLAEVYKGQGMYGRAEPLYQRALAIYEATVGPTHPDVADPLNNLAELYQLQGMYGRAEPLYQRSFSILEGALGGSHPRVATSLDNIARLRLAQHRLAEALPLFARSFAIAEQRLRQEALDFSESRLSGFLQYLHEHEQSLYTLLRAHPGDARVQRLALSSLLLLKGRSAEETANISRALYLGLGPEDRDILERLRGLRTRLANLSLEGPGSLTSEDYQRRLATLANEGDALEADLAKRSAPLRALTALPSPSEIVDRVAASLPRDGALVEFIAYRDRPLVPKPGAPPAKVSGQLRYLALVLLPDASTRAVDLGPAEPIDLAATRLRTALANRDASFQAIAHRLYQLAFKPLPLRGDIHRLLLSPDGQLSLVPFAALHDGRGYLLDSFDFTYLTSGRELLPRSQQLALASSVVVLADPDFTAAVHASPPAEPSHSLERFFSTVRGDLPSSTWVPLPGTRQEAESIQRLLPQAQLFLGPEATKQRLLQLSTPGILHLATHGFFLDDAPSAPLVSTRAVGHFGALGDNPLAPRPQEPLLRSGLALAGARAPASDTSTPSESPSNAALVTALELAGLDLWGTQLVVLSACDTGRGDVHLGQGVYGLRRALVVAGAETVVMSLWKVKDDSTRQLMDFYYRNLLAGQGRASALGEAMRSLRASHPHPHDWAPFIALGSDAPLHSVTPSRGASF